MVRRRLAAVAALAALALCAPATAHADDCAGADVVPAADNVAVVGQATLCLLNQQRAANGIGPLVENAALSTASAGYSQRMVAQGFFAHESPDGGTLVQRLTAVGYLGGDDAWVVGENIGWGQASLATARSMVTAWMNSPGPPREPAQRRLHPGRPRPGARHADRPDVGRDLHHRLRRGRHTPAPAHARAKAAAATRKKASRAASCARAASTRRGARTTKAKRSSACARSARVRRR